MVSFYYLHSVPNILIPALRQRDIHTCTIYTKQTNEKEWRVSHLNTVWVGYEYSINHCVYVASYVLTTFASVSNYILISLNDSRVKHSDEQQILTCWIIMFYILNLIENTHNSFFSLFLVFSWIIWKNKRKFFEKLIIQWNWSLNAD